MINPEKFTTISNVHINDARLSWKATSILTYLLSKPNDWTVYVKQLAKAKKDGIKAVYSGIKELKEYGYIEYIFIRDATGKMSHGEYIVHEEPIDVKTAVNPESDPYAHNGNAVNGNADNGTLLKTDSKIKTNDDQTAPPPNSTPKVNQKENPSPSFSQDDLAKIIATLMALAPKKFQKPSIEKTIERGLQTHTEDDIRLAILYAASNSNGGTWQKFKAYLGKCIEHHWHDGWKPDVDQGNQIDQEATREQFKRMSDKNLEFLADTGNIWAIEELKRRKR